MPNDNPVHWIFTGLLIFVAIAFVAECVRAWRSTRRIVYANALVQALRNKHNPEQPLEETIADLERKLREPVNPEVPIPPEILRAVQTSLKIQGGVNVEDVEEFLRALRKQQNGGKRPRIRRKR